MTFLGNFVLPIVITSIIIVAIYRKVPIFDIFLQGAKEGISSTISIMPSLIGLVTAVTMVKASGALDIFSAVISPITNFFGVPSDVIPMALIRPISGSGATALLDNILKENGADSLSGRIVSVMSGSTETTFYAITVYYSAVSIKHTRHTIPSALFADLVNAIISIIVVMIFFT